MTGFGLRSNRSLMKPIFLCALCTTESQNLVFCEDSPSVGQIGVRESPVTLSPLTNHFGRGLPRCDLLLKFCLCDLL